MARQGERSGAIAVHRLLRMIRLRANITREMIIYSHLRGITYQSRHPHRRLEEAEPGKRNLAYGTRCLGAEGGNFENVLIPRSGARLRCLEAERNVNNTIFAGQKGERAYKTVVNAIQFRF
jgi:hypothetical protein